MVVGGGWWLGGGGGGGDVGVPLSLIQPKLVSFANMPHIPVQMQILLQLVGNQFQTLLYIQTKN